MPPGAAAAAVSAWHSPSRGRRFLDIVLPSVPSSRRPPVTVRITAAMTCICLVAVMSAVHVCASMSMPMSPEPSAETCRDRFTWPFASTSIWNMPVGSGALFDPAQLFPSPATPASVFLDTEYFYATTDADPWTPWYHQGWWAGRTSHCTVIGPLVGEIQFPANATVTMGGNNAAALLLPDNVTLLQLQPLYRCKVGSPILAQDFVMHRENESILEDGMYGAHGGSGLSSIGGSLRLGELLPDSPPIRHALKLELFANHYFNSFPCFYWPARQCDGYAHNESNPLFYNGTNPYMGPGALLAVPSDLAAALEAQMSTIPGAKLLAALTDYGGYLVDDTAVNRFTICGESGVREQFQAAYGYDFNAVRGTPFYKDMLLIARALAVVINNSPSSIGGGGVPLQPLAPPIC